MALKVVLDKLEDVAEPFRKEYVAKDGKFHLQIEGEVPGFVPQAQFTESQTKLAEFRDNNRTLNTKVTEQTTKLAAFEGVDPAKYKTMETQLQTLGAKDGDIHKVVAAAVASALEPVTKELNQFKESDKQKTVDLARKTFESSMKDAAIKVGVDEKMLPHFIDAGMKIYKYEDGKFVPKKTTANGEVPYYSPTKATELITPEEWALTQVTEAPGFFKKSGGGGSGDKTEKRNSEGKPVISPAEIGANIEKIAKGEVVVQA